MIMNGEYDLEGVGHSLCEGAAFPFRDCYNLYESLQSYWYSM